MSLGGKKILVGLTGGIACYKVPYLIRALRKVQVEVMVVMTDASTKFITPLTLETVSENPVSVSMFPQDEYIATKHIDLAGWADLIVVAPTTANCIGKIASGISDDLLTTIICATPKPVMLAPAMNPYMWSNAVTQHNIGKLKELGFLTVGPDEGDMACDHVGVGRMSEPDVIFDAIEKFFSKSVQKKKP